MNISAIDQTPRQKPLRLWPGVAIVALQWLAWLVVPIAVPEATMYGILGGFLGGLAIVAQRGVRHRQKDPGLGFRELAVGGR